MILLVCWGIATTLRRLPIHQVVATGLYYTAFLSIPALSIPFTSTFHYNLLRYHNPLPCRRLVGLTVQRATYRNPCLLRHHSIAFSGGYFARLEKLMSIDPMPAGYHRRHRTIFCFWRSTFRPLPRPPTAAASMIRRFEIDCRSDRSPTVGRPGGLHLRSPPSVARPFAKYVVHIEHVN